MYATFFFYHCSMLVPWGELHIIKLHTLFFTCICTFNWQCLNLLCFNMYHILCREGKKKQNCKCVRYSVNNECRVLLVATRDIAKGERLYYDYNGYEHEYPTEHFLWDIITDIGDSRLTILGSWDVILGLRGFFFIIFHYLLVLPWTINCNLM